MAVPMRAMVMDVIVAVVMMMVYVVMIVMVMSMYMIVQVRMIVCVCVCMRVNVLMIMGVRMIVIVCVDVVVVVVMMVVRMRSRGSKTLEALVEQRGAYHHNRQTGNRSEYRSDLLRLYDIRQEQHSQAEKKHADSVRKRHHRPKKRGML